jgi:hypothetical protein
MLVLVLVLVLGRERTEASGAGRTGRVSLLSVAAGCGAVSEHRAAGRLHFGFGFGFQLPSGALVCCKQRRHGSSLAALSMPPTFGAGGRVGALA